MRKTLPALLFALLIVSVCHAQTPEPTVLPIPTATPVRLSEMVKDAKRNLIEQCLIKGNVNSRGDRIYHCPRWRDYDKTVVDPDKGDQWFCTEEEARAAGFRRPKNVPSWKTCAP